MSLLEVYPLTVKQVVTSSLRKLGIIRQGGVATSETFSEAMEALNLILKELGSLYKHEWLMNVQEITLITGTMTYDITLNAPVIDRLFAAYYIDTDATLTPCKVVDINELLSNGALVSNPVIQVYLYKYFTNQWNRVIGVHPAPANITTQKLRLVYRSEAKIPTLDTDILAIPYSLYRYIVFKLASDLSHEYGLNINEITLLENKAQAAFQVSVMETKFTSVVLRDHRYNPREQQGLPTNINEEH